MRNKLLILLALLVLSSGMLAQDEAFPEREIITVLDMGSTVFESDLWLASGAENIGSTTATWQSTFESGFSALSFINYLHFDEGYTLDDWTTFSVMTGSTRLSSIGKICARQICASMTR